MGSKPSVTNARASFSQNALVSTYFDARNSVVKSGSIVSSKSKTTARISWVAFISNEFSIMWSGRSRLQVASPLRRNRTAKSDAVLNPGNRLRLPLGLE